MFFSLNLIESYGSGIRRAKDALLENGSPKLKFYPDNDIDNYTNAVMGINVAFLKDDRRTTKETTKEIVNEKNSVQEQILIFMLNNPKITAEQIANELETISVNGIRYHIRKLKAEGRLKREGSTKSGKWIVIP